MLRSDWNHTHPRAQKKTASPELTDRLSFSVILVYSRVILELTDHFASASSAE